MTKTGKGTDNKNSSFYRFHALVILSQGTDGVDKSVYSTGLRQLLRPPLLLCKSCWVPWKGATQVKVCRPSPKYSDNLCSIDKYNLHCLLVSSEHISLIHAHMLSEGHKKRCFGAKWRSSSPRPDAETVGVYNNMVLPNWNFGLVEPSITAEKANVDEISLDPDMRWADIRSAWTFKSLHWHQSTTTMKWCEIDGQVLNYMIWY